jgi:hypothetical protein
MHTTVRFHKIVLCLILFCCHLALHAQLVLKGTIQTKSNKIVPGASVEYLHHKIGCMADGVGQFTTQKISGDTIRISSVGYKPMLFAVEDKTRFLEVYLEEESKVLSTVTVSNKKRKTVSLGYYSTHDFHREFCFLGLEQAVLIPNKKRVNGYISEIKFRLFNYEHSLYSLRVRLKLMDSITGLPSDSLIYFQEDIPAYLLSKVNRVLIRSRNIEVPSSGLFVTLEWISTGSTQVSLPNWPAITGRRVSEERHVYIRISKKDVSWRSGFSPEHPNKYFASEDGRKLYVPNISVLVSVPVD